jgi:hypothetical protein
MQELCFLERKPLQVACCLVSWPWRAFLDSMLPQSVYCHLTRLWQHSLSAVWLQLLWMQWCGLPTHDACEEVLFKRSKHQSPRHFSVLVEIICKFLNEEGKWLLTHWERDKAEALINTSEWLQRPKLYSKELQSYFLSIPLCLQVWEEF